MRQISTPGKIAAITASFWLAKIIATTLGETAGDFLAHTLKLGYIIGFAITSIILIGLLAAQISTRTYHALLFWAAIVATTTTGTEMSDLMDRTLGFGYVLGAAILSGGLALTLALWYQRKHNLSVDPVAARDTELFFWAAVVFSNSLGTAFGDALVDSIGLSYLQGAVVCSAIIAVVMALHYFSKANTVLLFWAAFIFTRPFGATFGDFLVKDHTKGGLQLGTLPTSLIALIFLVAVVATGHRLEKKPTKALSIKS